ncbi:hypothetical protein [Woodsholea maritima]|uniref:hypothetical protein n=1 Tax=Woodsholea maritima TaxID=240237 RepID=UPI00036BCD56|nr:hypothetical protein [Woodsholea maritima]
MVEKKGSPSRPPQTLLRALTALRRELAKGARDVARLLAEGEDQAASERVKALAPITKWIKDLEAMCETSSAPPPHIYTPSPEEAAVIYEEIVTRLGLHQTHEEP